MLQIILYMMRYMKNKYMLKISNFFLPFPPIRKSAILDYTAHPQFLSSIKINYKILLFLIKKSLWKKKKWSVKRGREQKTQQERKRAMEGRWEKNATRGNENARECNGRKREGKRKSIWRQRWRTSLSRRPHAHRATMAQLLVCVSVV